MAFAHLAQYTSWPPCGRNHNPPQRSQYFSSSFGNEDEDIAILLKKRSPTPIALTFMVRQSAQGKLCDVGLLGLFICAVSIPVSATPNMVSLKLRTET
jgi:hypothetical protein